MAFKDSDLIIIDRYFANKQYDRAIELLEKLHKKNPNAMQVRMKLADAYFLYGRTAKAVRILEEVAEEYASRGFTTKAIAVQQKIKRIDSTARIDIKRFGLEKEPAEVEISEEILEAGDKQEISPEAVFGILDGLFAGLSREEFDDVFRMFFERSVRLGELIIEEDVSGTSLFIILSGSVRVTTLHNGNEVELAVLSEGDFFGEVSLLTGKHRTADVTSLEECVLLELGKDNFLTLCERYPQFRHTLETTLERRAQVTIEKLLELENKEPTG